MTLAHLVILSFAASLGAGCASRQCLPAPALPATAATQAATAPAPDSAVPAWTPKTIVRQVNHRIEFGPYAFEVDAANGGRILELSVDGKNVLADREESPHAYGSSFWPSPQSAWQWPPPAAFDGRAWQARIEGTALVLESSVEQQLGLAGLQRFEADPHRGLVRVDLTLVNRGTTPRSVAPWQNSRLPPCGLTFYPSSTAAYPNSALKLAPTDGVVWFAHEPSAYPDNVKLYADGEEGWIAHVDGDLLFVKVFPDVPRDAQAPEEGEIVIYVDGSGRFVEVEQQGAYEALAAGQSSTWHVLWLARRLPPTLTAAVGNRELVDFVRKLVADSR